MSLRLLVLGITGRMPLAGITWQGLHYIEGLRRLGHDVWYIEDTGTSPYDPVANTISLDSGYTVSHLSRIMREVDMSGRWAYRHASGAGHGRAPCSTTTFGMSNQRVSQLFQTADALLNLTGSTLLDDEKLQVPARLYIETDPVVPQVEVAQGKQSTIDMLATHTHHFTFGENIGSPGCAVPVSRFAYRSTRQPVVLDWWSRSGNPASRAFTTIASWRQGNEVEWEGEVYSWSKHHEFLKFLDLPRRSGRSFELALADVQQPDLDLLARHGWSVIDGLSLSLETEDYRDFIERSRGEFTVAKDQNIRLRSGWFSDRSACYLAAGRPVITQDTGFGASLPTGNGLFAFSTMEEALAALDEVDGRYAHHSESARGLASECFRAETVLAKLLGDAGLS